jgi:hypothetical protein
MNFSRIARFFQKHYFLLALSAGLISYTLPYSNQKKGLLCIFISLAVLLAYNAHKLFKWLREEGSYAGLQSKRFLPTRILFFVSTLAFLWLGILLDFRWNEYFLLCILFFMCLSYSFFRPQLSIRSIPYLKSFFIALSWTSLCCALPMSYANKAIYNGSFFFILFYALAVSSDYRDLRIDPIELKTIPQVVSRKALLVLIFSCLLTFVAFNLYYFGTLFFIAAILSSLAFLYYLFQFFVLKKELNTDRTLLVFGLSAFILQVYFR